MRFEGNDRFVGSFHVTELGRWEFTVQAWVDRLASFRDELRRKVEGGQTDLESELQEGAALMKVLELDVKTALASTETDRREATQLVRSLAVECDREVARFGAWYELFPRSWGGFAGVEKVLPELKKLGFDVVYLPPIHPIGRTNRKGPTTRSPQGRGPGQSLGDRQRGRRSHSGQPRARDDQRISTASSRRRASSASRSRSTSRSSAPPTTRG